jgi:hypothetical protein
MNAAGLRCHVHAQLNTLSFYVPDTENSLCERRQKPKRMPTRNPGLVTMFGGLRKQR